MCDFIFSYETTFYVFTQNASRLNATRIFQTIGSDLCIHFNSLFCPTKFADISCFAPIIDVLNRKNIPVNVICGNQHFARGFAIVNKHLAIRFQICPCMMFILKDNCCNVFICREGQLEIHLFTGAIVHVQCKLSILNQFFCCNNVFRANIVQYFFTSLCITVYNTYSRCQECAGFTASIGNTDRLDTSNH